MRRSRRSPAAAVLVAASLLGLPACSSGGLDGAARDHGAEAVAAVDARLRGSWRLVSFVPEVPLDRMLQAMLEYQYQTLSVRFGGGRLVADSPGVHVDRAYEIRNAHDARFLLISYDQKGIPYESISEFTSDDELRVHSRSAPWKGMAVLRRATP